MGSAWHDVLDLRKIRLVEAVGKGNAGFSTQQQTEPRDRHIHLSREYTWQLEDDNRRKRIRSADRQRGSTLPGAEGLTKTLS